MDPQQAYRHLLDRLESFSLLNPDLTAVAVHELYLLAAQASGEPFEDIEDLAERLIDQYVNSPQKLTAAETLADYLKHLQQSGRLLAENNQAQRGPIDAPQEEHSVALVPREHYSPLEWCRVVNTAKASHSLIKAVEAVRRRNELVSTVIEHVFSVMQRLNAERAFQWEAAYLEEHRGKLDPDVVRDLINAWLGEDDLPRELLQWAEAWSGDENLMQQWPQVVRRADRLLCRHALNAWLAQHPTRNSSLAHLRFLVQRKRLDDATLLKWLKAALVDVGESILRFVSLGKSEQQGKAEDRSQKTWRSGAIVREIMRLEALFAPVILMADLILAVPDGANLFAVAFFGLVGPGRERWERKLVELAETAVRQAFLKGLRDGDSPLRIIKQLTFGDIQARERAIGELDALTMDFDSRRQREKVVRFLGIYYASYRQQDLLSAEVLRRYRSLMRLMHEDHLRRVLCPEHLEDILSRSILRDLAGVAADARRFLSQRRALDSTLEELVASELEFIQGVRQRRLRLVHTLLE